MGSTVADQLLKYWALAAIFAFAALPGRDREGRETDDDDAKWRDFVAHETGLAA